MKAQKLHDHFVAEVSEIDFREEQPIEVKRELMHLLGEHKILLFRNQRIDTSQLVRFGQIFGRLWGPDDGLENNRASMVDDNEYVYLVSDKGMLGTFELGWHSDLSWWPCAFQPARILYGVNIDFERIQTPVLFFDLESVYAEVKPDDKEACQRCIAMYKILQPRKNDLYVQRYGGAGLPAMSRPLVRRHPYTGRLGFNDLGIFLTKGGTIVGNDLDRSDREIKDFILNLLEAQADKYVWKHVYREGDLLIHDNISTMHARPKITGTVDDHASRELKRVTLDIVWNQYVPTGAMSERERELETA
jgi:alpha-ketoglutarate-dependent taurine dioxygenase